MDLSWFRLDEFSGNVLTISASDNLPNSLDGNVNSSTIEDYMKSYCDLATVVDSYDSQHSKLFDYLENKQIVETSSRTVKLVVEYSKGSNTGLYSYYSITQPGFKDPRVEPVVTLSKPDLISLEKSNIDTNGVLTNQFQFFVDIDITNFNYDTWGKYDSSVTLDLTLKTASDNYDIMKKTAVISSRKIATVKLFPETDASVRNNYLSLTSDIMFPPAKVNDTLDNIDQAIIDSSDRFTADSSWKFYDMQHIEALTDAKVQDTCFIDSSLAKKYLFIDASIENSFKSPEKFWSGLYRDITLKVNNITLDEAVSSDKIKLRVFFEVGEPLAAALSMNFYVDKITIHYSNKDFVYDGTNKTYTLSKLYDVTPYKLPSMMTGLMSFYINPVSLVAAPKEIEKDVYKTTYIDAPILLTGTEDTLQVGMKLFGQDSVKAVTDIAAEKTLDTRIQAGYYDWTCWTPKVSYMQDNERYVSAVPQDPMVLKTVVSKYDLFRDSISRYDIDFNVINRNEQTLTLYDKFYSQTNLSKYDSNAYLDVVYKSKLLKARYINDSSIFYYNGNIKNADNYSQFEYNAPFFINSYLDNEVRSDELVSAMEVWNAEYLYGDNYSPLDKAIDGKLSKYGNGYLFLDASADVSQYSTELSLVQTKAQNDVSILVDWYYSDASLTSPQASKVPETLYRPFIYNIKWEYPLFADYSTIKPMEITDSATSLYDYLYLDSAYNYTKQKYKATDRLDETAVKNFRKEYLEKTAAVFADVSVNYDSSDFLTEKYNDASVFTKFIPYTWTYNIYPRVMFNKDNGFYNVLMLKSPAIGSALNKKFTYKDSYFSFASDDSIIHDCSVPYSQF